MCQASPYQIGARESNRGFWMSAVYALVLTSLTFTDVRELYRLQRGLLFCFKRGLTASRSLTRAFCGDARQDV